MQSDALRPFTERSLAEGQVKESSFQEPGASKEKRP